MGTGQAASHRQILIKGSKDTQAVVVHVDCMGNENNWLRKKKFGYVSTSTLVNQEHSNGNQEWCLQKG